jgi:hypothetical protein
MPSSGLVKRFLGVLISGDRKRMFCEGRRGNREIAGPVGYLFGATLTGMVAYPLDGRFYNLPLKT